MKYASIAPTGHASLVLKAGAGMEPTGFERDGRSPQGELSGDSESSEPACDANPFCSQNPSFMEPPPSLAIFPPHIDLLTYKLYLYLILFI
jgi:hypothetical protein